MNDPESVELPVQNPEHLLDTVRQELVAGDEPTLRARIEPLRPKELAHLLESLPLPERTRIWELIPEDLGGEVLAQLGDIARDSLVKAIDPSEVVAAAGSLEIPELAHVIETLPLELRDAVQESLDEAGRSRLAAMLAYPEDSAARLTDPNTVAVRAEVSLDVVLRYLRFRASLPDHTDGLMVIDRDSTYRGKLPISVLLTHSPETPVGSVMDELADYVTVHTPRSEIAALFERRGLVSVAVVDDEHKLVGRVTIDDVVDVIRGQAEHQIMNMAGLEEGEDLFAPILSSARRRAFWLGINLATAFLASWVIGLFQATIDQVVALAVLMPIVASMGGISGSQTLTLAIRGLALGKISASNRNWLARKELAISLLNGLVWALVVGLIAYLWFHDPRISAVLAAAMIANLFAAAFSGIVIPLMMLRVGIDPALAGSVVLTTVTDVVGFMSFLGLATWVLL